MKKVISFCVFFTFFLLAQAQEPNCGVVNTSSQNISMTCMMNFGNKDNMPIANIRVRFHFLPRLDGRPQFTQQEAFDIATSMVSFSNQNLSNLNQANVPGPNGLPPNVQDSRIQLQLYSTTGDNGVVVYNSGSSTDIPQPDSYGTNVVNIIFRYCYTALPDSTSSCCSNEAVGFNTIYFCNIWTTIKQASAQLDRSRLLVHEMGHILDLGHTWVCGTTCDGVDISSNQECGGTCNSDPYACSFRGNNIMSYKFGNVTDYNTSLTPCQWEHIFNWIEANQPPFVVYDCQKNNTPLTVSGGSVTWDDLRLINRDVIVQSGTTLTINCEVRFVNGCKIQVQSGASLIVNSTKITNLCYGQWAGIESQGNVTLNGATLEHAVTSISRQSGTVNATNATFSNNMRDVEYLDKPQSPVDIFTNCSFKVNESYRGSIIRSRVTMWNSQGVNFRGCTFKNEYSNPWALSWNPQYDWQGIYAVESGFYVDELDGTPSIFDKFWAGIRTVNITQNRNAEIRNSRFVDNQAGVISENTNSLVVYKNKFFVNWGTSFNSYQWYRVGLLINTGSSYDIRNNDFIGNLSNGGSGQYIFGSQVIRTGASENRMEGNNFTNLYVGHRVLGNNTNANSSSPSGLQLLCSENSQNIYDHDIEDDGDFNSGIRAKQGYSTNPDGNRFSNNGVGPDIWSNTLPYERFYQTSLTNALASSVVGSVTQSPVSPASNCIPFVPFMRRADNNVATNQSSSTDITYLTAAQLSQLSEEYEELDAALQKVKKQHSNLMDGGNQGQLITNIRTRWNRDTALLRSNLMVLSPNVSSEALVIVAQLNVLSNQNLMQLLRANPSSCRSNKLVKVLKQELRTPFLDTDIQSLWSISGRGSERYDLEDAINTYSSKRGEVARSLINGMVGNEEANRDQLRYWWKRIGTQSALYSLAESYIKDNQSNSYQSQLRNLSRDLADFELQVKENDDYVELYGIKSKVLKDGRSWKEMTTVEIEKVRRIANSTRADAAVQANNILCYAFGECKSLVIPRLSNEGIIAQPEPSPALMMSTKRSNQFLAYPNPARNTINVDYNLTDKFEDAYISLFDFTGREIKRQKLVANQSQVQWQTDQLQSGLYLISIYADNRLVWKTKVSVQK